MLRDLQKSFLGCYYKKEPQFLNYLCNHSALSSEERLAIYAGSITEGLAKALRENFPVAKQLVGDDFFHFMSLNYMFNVPSSSPNLADYGESFAEFVANFPEAQSLPYLADVCRLEWCWHKAYYGLEHTPLDTEKLSQLEPNTHSQLIFKRCPNSYLIKSNFPIYDIWQYHQTGDANQGVIDLESHKDHLLIWRPKMDVMIDSLTEAEWLILQGIESDLTLAELSTQLPQIVDLSTAIPKMVTRGWVTDFELKK